MPCGRHCSISTVECIYTSVDDTPTVLSARSRKERCDAKPRSHQQHCRSNIVECYKSNDSFDKVEINWTCSICFDFVELTTDWQNFTKNSFTVAVWLSVTWLNSRWWLAVCDWIMSALSAVSSSQTIWGCFLYGKCRPGEWLWIDSKGGNGN